MRRENLLARMTRALAGKSQEQMGEETGIHPTIIASFERGRVVPQPEHLNQLADKAGLTVQDAEEIFSLFEALRRSERPCRGRNADEVVLSELSKDLKVHTEAAYRRLLALPLPAVLPNFQDRSRAEELWNHLKDLPNETRLAIVRVAGEFQSWALCERVCAESVTEASRKLEHSVVLAHLAQEIAARVPGPEGWRLRLQGYAAAHWANVIRVSGDLKASDAAFESAKRLWHVGTDPEAVLDPGRLVDLEASLRRDQRRFPEALALLDEALSVGRFPARVLVKKGFTLEVTGDYGHAVETLLQAELLVESQGDHRLLNILRCNLAFNYCHLGRFAEAAELERQVCTVAAEMGDEIGSLRVTWLKGRIAAGLGRLEEALRLLGQARQEFSRRGMTYDVALALLEEAALLLEAGQTAEVKALTRELAQVFESKGVHREALAALRLFQKAADREEASAELARRVLAYLFRAHHDQGLRFES